MRRSERVAAIAVALMVVPAFLVFPALGVRWIMHVWPSLTIAQRTGFCLSLAMLGFSVPYLLRRHLDALWYGRTKTLSLFEEALILVPFAVGAWSLTGNWAAAIGVLAPKVMFSFARKLDGWNGRTEAVNVRMLTEPADVEPSPVIRLVWWLKSRRRTSARRSTITMGPRRAKSRKHRGR